MSPEALGWLLERFLSKFRTSMRSSEKSLEVKINSLLQEFHLQLAMVPEFPAGRGHHSLKLTVPEEFHLSATLVGRNWTEDDQILSSTAF